LEKIKAEDIAIFKKDSCQVALSQPTITQLTNSFVQTEETTTKNPLQDTETQTSNTNLFTNKYNKHLQLPRILTPTSSNKSSVFVEKMEKLELISAKENAE